VSEPTTGQLTTLRQKLQALDRCNADAPTDEDLAAARKLLKGSPDLWRVYGDVCDMVTRNVISGIRAAAGVKESISAGREAMLHQFGYETAPLMERMLIDHILLCWLRLQLAEHRYTSFWQGDGSTELAMFWEKRLSAVQRRYLRAVETLARIRRMDLPAIQVNVADKQVNIA